MNCSRCQGLLCFSELRDEVGVLITEGAPAFRCIQCGELTDSVILMNRTRSPVERKPRHRAVFRRRVRRVLTKEPHETGGNLLLLRENPR